MSEPKEIVGTWDALEDAAELLRASGLVFVMTVAMPGSPVARTRTNADCLDALSWLEKRERDAIESLKRGYDT
jgi:hypothetical protein